MKADIEKCIALYGEDAYEKLIQLKEASILLGDRESADRYSELASSIHEMKISELSFRSPKVVYSRRNS